MKMSQRPVNRIRERLAKAPAGPGKGGHEVNGRGYEWSQHQVMVLSVGRGVWSWNLGSQLPDWHLGPRCSGLLQARLTNLTMFLDGF